MKKLILLILFILLYVSFASAVTYVEDAHGVALSNDQAKTTMRGINFTTHFPNVVTGKLIYVNKTSSCDGTRAILYNGVNVGQPLVEIVNTTSLSGDVFTFSPAVDLNNSTSYIIGIFKDGASYNNPFAESGGPQDETNVFFGLGVYDDGGNFGDSSNYFNLDSITTYEIEPPTPPVPSSYNNTGGINPGNQTAWTDVGITEESRTEDDTPTINLVTDDTSNCSIGLTDKNYSDMIPTYGNPCATSETTSHSCTLNETFALKQGNQPLYIGCQSNDGENETSSSGPLNITLGYKTISGYVQDNNTGTGIPGATVIATKQEPYQDLVTGYNIKKNFNTTTGADGFYSMFVFKGNYSVSTYNETIAADSDVKSWIVVE